MNEPKLAYLLKKFPRLSETFVLNEILAQEDVGANIHVFSRREPDDETQHPQLPRLKAKVEVLPGTTGIDPWRELFVEGDGELVSKVAPLVREMHRFQLPRLHKVLAEALYLLRRTRELAIDHVHAHFATESALVAMILHELGGPTYSITAHAKDIYRSTVDPELLSRLLRESEFTATVCDANVRHLDGIVSSAAMAKVRRLYNGIDLETFRPSDSPRPANQVLAVGRLVEKKGFDVLLKALWQLKSRGISLNATIVGDGDERERLLQLIEYLDLGSEVTLAGAKDQAEVRRLMERATVLCQPCVTGADGNRDALPTVLLEALAVGLPCISTPVTGIPEILGDGAAGMIVKEGDADETAQALETVLGDADLRSRMARAGRARAEQLFDARDAARTLNAWFQESTARVVC